MSKKILQFGFKLIERHFSASDELINRIIIPQDGFDQFVWIEFVESFQHLHNGFVIRLSDKRIMFGVTESGITRAKSFEFAAFFFCGQIPFFFERSRGQAAAPGSFWHIVSEVGRKRIGGVFF